MPPHACGLVAAVAAEVALARGCARRADASRPRVLEPLATVEIGAAMAPISRGFRGRRRPDVDPARVPPGQYVVDDFPVLSAGPTPHTPLEQWSFEIAGAVAEPASWTWEQLQAMPAETLTVDIHC